VRYVKKFDNQLWESLHVLIGICEDAEKRGNGLSNPPRSPFHKGDDEIFIALSIKGECYQKYHLPEEITYIPKARFVTAWATMQWEILRV
jgi:hypothetical protein